MPDFKETDDPKQLEDFLATARKRFQDDQSDERNIREQALLDLRFVAGDQWDSAVKTERTSKGRPALTFNRMHTFVQQVSNEARQQKLQFKYAPTDKVATQATAEVYEGLAREIQYNTDAQVAYETASEYAAGGSFGYFGFLTDYCDDDSFEQEIKVRPFFDPFAVYGILMYSLFGIEPKHAFVIEEIPTAEYKRLYDTAVIDSAGWDQATKMAQGWIGTETVRVAEYWTMEEKEDNLLLVQKGRRQLTVRESQGIPKGAKVLRERKVQVPYVSYRKTNGFEILKGTETDWAGYCIPIIPVLGKQMILDGSPALFSVVRFQRDPQQLINFYKTRIAETLGTQPVQPFILYEGQVAGHEREWNELNTTVRPWLTIKAVEGPDGATLPPPQRNVVEPPIQALSTAAAQEVDDMKATAGIFDPSLGDAPNDTSGIAIQRRQQQANITNMHFMDNLERAFKKAGDICIDLIPKIYDSERMVRILGPDERPKVVQINAPYQDEDGNTHEHTIGGEDAGKYDVVVTIGKGFSTKRMESFDMMTSILQTAPNLLPMIGDIFFANSDVAGADQLADRFKKILNMTHPGITGDQTQAQLAQAQQQLQIMGANTQAMQAELQKLQLEKAGKVIDNEYKTDRETKLAQMQNDIKVLTALIEAKSQKQDQETEMFMTFWKENHGAAHDLAMQKDQQSNDAQMAQQAHQNALEQGQQQGAMASQQSAQDAAQNQALPSGNGLP